MIMYNNNSFDFNYDLNVIVKDRKTGKEVVSFSARENEPVVNNAGFEAGGVASGGHNYSIATNANVFEKIKPYSQQAIVDGVEYKVISKGRSKATLRVQFSKKKKTETIIYLG